MRLLGILDCLHNLHSVQTIARNALAREADLEAELEKFPNQIQLGNRDQGSAGSPSCAC